MKVRDILTIVLAMGAIFLSQGTSMADVCSELGLGRGCVSTRDLKGGAVKTAKIANGAVTAAKISAPLSFSQSSINPTINGTNTGDGRAVQGMGSNNNGVYGQSFGESGVFGMNTDSGNHGYVGGTDYGAYGKNENNGNYGYLGGIWGVYGYGANNHGVLGFSSDSVGVYGQSTSSYAGYFNGTVHVHGHLSKSAGSFKIDHPLDPENKYLYHSFVESPDMKNIYDGVAVLDKDGEARVELPDWFEALNRDYRYQLTPIGAPGPDLYIAEEVYDNTFMIAGGFPGMKVSWQITGIRQDPYADAHPVPVEEEKRAEEKGYYLHPSVYGEPEQMSVQWARNAETMRLLTQMTDNMDLRLNSE
jgi:hypothetical protein